MIIVILLIEVLIPSNLRPFFQFSNDLIQVVVSILIKLTGFTFSSNSNRWVLADFIWSVCYCIGLFLMPWVLRQDFCSLQARLTGIRVWLLGILLSCEGLSILGVHHFSTASHVFFKGMILYHQVHVMLLCHMNTSRLCWSSCHIPSSYSEHKRWWKRWKVHWLELALAWKLLGVGRVKSFWEL